MDDPYHISASSVPAMVRTQRLHLVAGVLALVAGLASLATLAKLDTVFGLSATVSTRPTIQVVDINGAYFDWKLILVSLPTAMHHLWLGRMKTILYSAIMEQRFSSYRWAEYAVTSTAMTTRIAVLCGVSDLATLVLMAAGSVCMISLGSLCEWCTADHNRRQRLKPLLRIYDSLSIGIFSLTWVIIMATFFTALHLAAAGPPSWVYGLVFVMFLGMTAFPVVAHKARKMHDRPYVEVERNYVWLSLIVKQLYFYILIFGYRSYTASESA